MSNVAAVDANHQGRFAPDAMTPLENFLKGHPRLASIVNFLPREPIVSGFQFEQLFKSPYGLIRRLANEGIAIYEQERAFSRLLAEFYLRQVMFKTLLQSSQAVEKKLVYDPEAKTKMLPKNMPNSYRLFNLKKLIADLFKQLMGLSARLEGMKALRKSMDAEYSDLMDGYTDALEKLLQGDEQQSARIMTLFKPRIGILSARRQEIDDGVKQLCEDVAAFVRHVNEAIFQYNNLADDINVKPFDVEDLGMSVTPELRRSMVPSVA